MAIETILNAEDQRQFQANFWKLEPGATWGEIRDVARAGTIFLIGFDPDDWEEIMIRLYGSEIFTEH